MAVFVTGVAGFIGYHASMELLQRGETVVGVDNLNSYYDVSLKLARLKKLKRFSNFSFTKLDIADFEAVKACLMEVSPERILHLAAQAGVRYSLENPMAYVRSNLVGHVSVLEAARALKQQKPSQLCHFVYASSSSVYGECKTAPFQESFSVDHPVSLYAATKKADELLSHSYAHLYSIAQTGLRFFTVYGRWGRPDMAYWLFTEAMLEGRPISVFNKGKMERDFTYIGDIIPTLMDCLYDTPEKHTHRVYNIGGENPVSLWKMIGILEELTGRKVEKQLKPMQAGDVQRTSADVSEIRRKFGYRAKTPLEEGLKEFVSWYRDWKS